MSIFYRLVLIILLLNIFVACSVVKAPIPNDKTSKDGEFSQQVILVTVAEGLEDEFVIDTYRLAAIPGVVNLRIAKPVEFPPEHKNPSWWIEDYDFAIFIEFASEEVTEGYGAHPIHKAWDQRWGVKELPTFRAFRAVGPMSGGHTR